MTQGDVSYGPLEAIRPKTIISTKTTTTIGTWNVQTIYYSRNPMSRARRDRQQKLEYRTSGRRVVKAQPHHPMNQLIKTDWFLAEATDFW
ncbi:hypothetical protein DPMN_005303 [Dreissena polymorpha]|uniref:Uncharacterized protein n=1 Tax=Dreissena polymorpha TaxID=45954 RepID=A0A9D4MPE1_DREPO|nr:hypothetical protein DPMN_005303 [Dreissena polymorpha]